MRTVMPHTTVTKAPCLLEVVAQLDITALQRLQDLFHALPVLTDQILTEMAQKIA